MKAVIPAIAALLASCTRGEPSNLPDAASSAASTRLDTKTWTWIKTTYVDGNEVLPRQTAAFTLTFRADGTFSGTTDCNALQGRYAQSGSALTFDDVAATMMFCAESQESTFTELLERNASHSFTSRGELVLRLADDGGSAIFR